jgi:hypothetical protein
MALRPAHDVELMPMPILALLRIVSCGVAVEAARMNEDRIDLLPGGESLSSGGGFSASLLLGRTGKHEATQNEHGKNQSDGPAIRSHR